MGVDVDGEAGSGAGSSANAGGACLTAEQVLRLIQDFYFEWLELQRLEGRVKTIRGFRAYVFDSSAESND